MANHVGRLNNKARKQIDLPRVHPKPHVERPQLLHDGNTSNAEDPADEAEQPLSRLLLSIFDLQAAQSHFPSKQSHQRSSHSVTRPPPRASLTSTLVCDEDSTFHKPRASAAKLLPEPPRLYAMPTALCCL